MFPSSHDITPLNLNACENVIYQLINAGNDVLVVSKPHFECIESLCSFFKYDREKILFRFTIGARDDAILSYWEPNAPAYDERLASLIYAYENGFETSVSVEPMLDSANIDALISDLSPYVTNAIWVGTMNHLGRFEKGSDMVLRQAIKTIQRGQTDANIKAIYQRYKHNPLIKWKKEIKKNRWYPNSEREWFGYVTFWLFVKKVGAAFALCRSCPFLFPIGDEFQTGNLHDSSMRTNLKGNNHCPSFH